uniref:GB1/RHD3-type G domain-containing protein n=1 Tax=Scleropages formosus TaxID=113540 RepID=A0A8D0CKK5_SCLFO
MESPVCLIENIDGTLRVVQEATEYLMRINQPVVVVAVVGLYRTGKSYLMNKLAGKRKGFALGATVQSKTKGIWMWCVPHPVKEGHTLVLLDTEGLGDVEKDDQKNNAWIFSLAILLSSTLVYKSRGTIDNQAVENLQYVTELTERIKVKAPSASSAKDDDAEDAQFVQFFPSFVWAVRDFTLQLQIDRRQVNEDQYLEHALTLKKVRIMRTVDYNLKCFIFETPAPPEKMAHLESMTESELSPSFQAVAFDFCNYIFKESSVKKVKGGLPVTGRSESTWCVPCLENAVLTMARIENQTAVEEGLQVCQRGMQGLTFPVSMEEMLNAHRHWDSQATKTFMSRSFKEDSGEYLKTLVDAINKEYASFLLRNEDMSEKVCRQLLPELSEDMANKLKNGFYAKPGGYELYCSDHDNLVAEYRKRPKKGVKTHIYECAKEKVKAAMLEQEKKAEEQKRLELERTLQDERRSQEEKLQMMREKMEEDLKTEQEMARALQSKLQEQEQLMSRGFQEKQAAMLEEIQKLQEEMKEAKERQEMDRVELIKNVTSAISEGVNHYLEYKKIREQRKLLANKTR